MTDDNTTDYGTDFEGTDFDGADLTPADFDAVDLDDDGSTADGDLGDLGPDDYQRAAELMAEQADQDQGDGIGDDYTDTEGNIGPRDARYRSRMRDAQARLQGATDENARLLGQLETVQRAEVLRLAGARLFDAQDVWRDGAQLADLVADDGSVDTDAVNATVDRLLEVHPHWRAQLPPYSGPLHSGATAVPIEMRPRGFSDAFTPKAD